MLRWKQFGEQVNCMIYSLAGQKYQGDIELTNRLVAQQIHYSEASLRAMRQGRFRPQEDSALVTLVEIGFQQAGLSRAWAEALLRYGSHPNAHTILSQYALPDRPAASLTSPSTSSWLLPRLVWMTLTTCICLLYWAYGISPVYPAA